jgi:hypothetical protein
MMGAVPALDCRSEDRSYCSYKGKAPLTVQALVDVKDLLRGLGLFWCPPFSRGCISADSLLG